MVALADTDAGVAVAEEVRAILGMAALAVPGGALSGAPRACWARLLWTCCAAAGGSRERALPAAAAVELFMAALDLLDDAEDGEVHPSHAVLGAPRALNASTGLLLLAQRVMLDRAGGAAASVLLAAGMRACCGQHADLAPGNAPPPGLDDALGITARKSASLVAGICEVGALIAGANELAQAEYARFGWHIGMIKQLANDMAAVGPEATGKTDLALGRPTVPLAYAATSSHAGSRGVAVALRTGEPVAFTWALAETYRRQALELVPRLTGNPARCRTLAMLIDTL